MEGGKGQLEMKRISIFDELVQYTIVNKEWSTKIKEYTIGVATETFLRGSTHLTRRLKYG